MRIAERRSRLFIAALALTMAGTGASLAQGLTSMETGDMRLLYFDPVQTYLAPYVARCFHNSLEGHQALLGFEPDERATVFLKDYTDYGNAAAGAAPRNTVLIDVAPQRQAFETLPSVERMYRTMSHELAHVVAMDQGTAADMRARKFFGGKVRAVSDHPETILYAYLTNPRRAAPRWYHEGFAVFMETWMAGGYGRAQGAYDEMVFRSMVRDDAYFYDPLGLESEGSKIDFQVGANNYLYGTRFMSYLAYMYSPEMLVEWARRKEGSKGHYTAHFEQVFGLSLNEVWQDWIDFEHEFQNANLEAVRQYPITPHRDLSDRGLGSISRTYFDPETRELYWGLRYPGTVAYIGSMSLDSRETRRHVEIKGPILYKVTSLAFDPDSRTLFYTTDHSAFRDVMAHDLQTAESRMLLKDARIGELVFNKADRSLWGVRHLNGIATLVRMPFPYEQWNQVYSFPYANVLFDMDISPDGQLLSTSFGEPDGSQSVRVFEIEALLEGDITPYRQFDVGQAIPEGFVFSPDGRYLFGSSYYTGISNIFRFELETEGFEAVSNAEAGMFKPVPMPDGTLIVFRYTGQGFVPTVIDPVPLEDVSAITFFGTEIVSKYPELRDWEVGSPADVPLDDMITAEDEYTGMANLGLEAIYPIIEGYKDEIALGMNTTWSDAIMLDKIDFSVSHSIASDLPSSEDIHAKFVWQHVVTRQTPLSGTWTATLRHNAADFYDLFGPTKRSRKGQSATVLYEKTLIYDEPRQLDLTIDASHWRNMDALPRYQNIDVDIDNMTTFAIALQGSHIRSSLGNVDDEKGIKWSLAASSNYVESDLIPKLAGNFDFGFELPMRNSSLWFRNAAGIAFGEVDDVFANFFFGGFGNNWVDSGDVKRYRRAYAMPGFELNELGGRNFYRSMIEWNLPPIRFRNVGGSRFFLSWARPAIFASTLTTNNDDSAIRRNVSNVGAQIDFRFTLMSNLDMTLSIGYAVGTGDNVDSADEFMASLKIL